MKVKTLIKKLQKLDPNTIVGTFAEDKYDFELTPINIVFLEQDTELHEDYRGRGKKRFSDYVVLVGVHQKWHKYVNWGDIIKNLIYRKK